MSGQKPKISQHDSDFVSIIKQQSELKPIEPKDIRILAIDDEPNILHSTQVLLQAKGFNCQIADGGEAGLKVLQTLNIDIVLLDLAMPEVDGYKVLKELDRLGINAEVIIISGDATFENAKNVFKNGACDFLSKPYKPQQLISAIEKIIYKIELKNQLKTVQSQLKQTEQRYRFIASNSPDIIYLIDDKGYFIYINERVVDLLGFLPEELIGKHYSMLIENDEAQKAGFIFNERRTGIRSSQNVELMLKCNDPFKESKIFESNTIPIELNSMGIYEDHEGGTPFLGTYGVARDISERKKAEETIHFQAYHDLLTKLPNRDLFIDRLNLSISQSERNNTKIGILFLDMDGFKYINDTLGHIVGDNLLQHVSIRIQELLRNSDTVSRVGGDEFNILIPELQHKDEAALVAKKIIEDFNSVIVLDKQEVKISFSIGIAMYPDDGKTTVDLIKNADMAMYHIKTRGKNGFEFFSDNMQSIYQHRHDLEQDIKAALDEKQFVPYYQPQYKIPEKEIFGTEALIRWIHPKKGLISPDEFIPVAEEIGLINEIGLYMLELGCKQIKTWIDDGFQPVKVSVNVSSLQLTEVDFDTTVCNMVKRYNIPQHLLMLEITESALLHDIELVIQRLKNISECGVGISIDDFGVGYSSLSYLQKLPVNMLKIDRSFIEGSSLNDNNSRVLKGIIALAKELELGVVVEGVETNQQLNYVDEIGCSIIQGFLLGRPVPEVEFTKLLTRLY